MPSVSESHVEYPSSEYRSLVGETRPWWGTSDLYKGSLGRLGSRERRGFRDKSPIATAAFLVA